MHPKTQLKQKEHKRANFLVGVQTRAFIINKSELKVAQNEKIQV